MEEKTISEEAIYKMTKKPATTFNMADRGELKEGAYADIIIFNSETIIVQGTFTEPIQFPAGIEHVIINGEFTIKNGEHTGNRNGVVLKKKGIEVVK